MKKVTWEDLAPPETNTELSFEQFGFSDDDVWTTLTDILKCQLRSVNVLSEYGRIVVAEFYREITQARPNPYDPVLPFPLVDTTSQFDTAFWQLTLLQEEYVREAGFVRQNWFPQFNENVSVLLEQIEYCYLTPAEKEFFKKILLSIRNKPSEWLLGGKVIRAKVDMMLPLLVGVLGVIAVLVMFLINWG